MRHVTLAACVILAACGGPATREVQGQLAGISLSKAMVLSETTDRQVGVAHVSPDGRFAIEVAVDVPARLIIAREGQSGVAVAERHIGPEWFKVAQGPRLDLGLVRPEGVANPQVLVEGTATPTSGSCGSTPKETPTSTTTPAPGRADLPYDVKLSVGQSFKLTDAFLEKGPVPAKIVSVTMDGGDWRLAELKANASFTVTAADCAHMGNRDVGRDRAFITWENADGSQETDHLDLRYCDGGGSSSAPLSGDETSGGSSSGSGSGGSDDGACHEAGESPEVEHGGHVEVENCGTAKADCDAEKSLEATEASASTNTCSAPGGAAGGATGGTTGVGSTPPAGGTGSTTGVGGIPPPIG